MVVEMKRFLIKPQETRVVVVIISVVTATTEIGFLTNFHEVYFHKDQTK